MSHKNIRYKTKFILITKKFYIIITTEAIKKIYKNFFDLVKVKIICIKLKYLDLLGVL